MAHSPAKSVLALLVLSGCGGLLPPATVEGYDYRGVGTIGDVSVPLAFHWPRSSLPVKVFVEPAPLLQSSLDDALEQWSGVFLYGELRFQLVADSTLADIVVRDENPTKPGAAIRLDSRGAGCFGSTDFDADPAAGTLTLPFRVRLSSLSSGEDPDLKQCYDAVMLHEIGHAVGILAHSGDPDDIMNPNPIRATLSERDRATVILAYHLPANLRPIRE